MQQYQNSSGLRSDGIKQICDPRLTSRVLKVIQSDHTNVRPSWLHVYMISYLA